MLSLAIFSFLVEFSESLICLCALRFPQEGQYSVQHFPHILFYFIYKFILFYLFLAALGLRCCTRAFSSCGEQGLLFVAVRGLLIVVASLCCRAWALGMRASVVVARGLSSCGTQSLKWRLSSCGTQA